MKVRHHFDLDFVQFAPRSWCFAESDAADLDLGGGGGAEETPDIDVDVPEETPEPDDLEDIEFRGRKYRIPKDWKDPLEQGEDYRYKTGKLAEKDRAVEAEKTRYSQLVKQAEETIKANQPTRPDSAMLDRMSDKYDPDTYHLQRARWEGWAQQAYNAENERKRLESETQTKSQREREERRAKSEADSIREVPQWKDSAARAADRVKAENYLKERFGMDPDEAKEMDYDHRLKILAHESRLYREAVAKAKANRSEVVPVSLPTPPRKVSGGGGSSLGGPPKGTDAFIAWRRKGGKM